MSEAELAADPKPASLPGPPSEPPEPQSEPKGDPASFVLRGSPARAVRFKRGLIVALAGIASLALAIVSWSALRQRIVPGMAVQEEQTEPAAKPEGDTLGRAPVSYSDIPKLGPPLPGDLGKPILDRQRWLAAEAGEGAQPPSPAEQAAQAARERQLADLQAARASALLVGLGARPENAVAEPLGAAAPDSTSPPPEARIEPDAGSDPNGQQRKAAFVATLDRSGDVNPHALAPPASPYMLSAGSVIAASLITGLSSDLPGLVTAQVTENTFDTATGRILLVPQGSRLIGRYDSVVAFGQKRALVIWQRIILPDGSSLRLDNMPATDTSGYAGLADKVDLHTWQLLKGVALSTLLGVGAELQFSGDGDLVEAIRQSTQQSVSRAGDQLTSRALTVQPSITVRPGTPVRLIVQKDLVLAPWRG